MLFKGSKTLQPYQKHLILREGIEGITPYEVTLPDPPPIEEFINYGKPWEEQVFRYEEIPNWVWSLTRKYKNPLKRKEVIETVRNNDVMLRFIADQWHKRKHGIFIIICGVPMYIPGNYWCFLNYYNLKRALPEFRLNNLEYWYWWNYCIVDDPLCIGGVEMEPRRDGKSSRAGGNLWETTSRSVRGASGVISKNSQSAKDFFSEFVVLPWKKMPFFFSPLYDNKEYPINKLIFRNGDVAEEEDSDGLNSYIEAGTTTATYFDGRELLFFVGEEWGKTDEMKVSEALRIVSKSVWNGRRVVGKMIITSTVEEMSKGGLKEYKIIWDAADHGTKKYKDTGRTQNRLKRISFMAWESRVTDQFGFPIIDNPEQWQSVFLLTQYSQKEIDLDYHLKGGKELVDLEIDAIEDPYERQQHIRMQFRNIKEAFRSAPVNSDLNLDIIYSRLMHYSVYNEDVISIDLEWEKGNIGDNVIPTINENGRFLIKKSIYEFLLKIGNKVDWTSGYPAPTNDHLGCLGGDPYKYDATRSERKSLGTCMGYMNYIVELDGGKPEDEWISEDYFIEYGARYASKEPYAMDLAKLCVWLGMKLFCENNIPYVNEKFIEWGLHNYLKYRIQRTQGQGFLQFKQAATAGDTTAGDATKEPKFEGLRVYWNKAGKRCVFTRFAEDSSEIEYKNWTDFDYAVSAMYARYGAKGANTVKPAVMREVKQEGEFWDPEEGDMDGLHVQDGFGGDGMIDEFS